MLVTVGIIVPMHVRARQIVRRRLMFAKDLVSNQVIFAFADECHLSREGINSSNRTALSKRRYCPAGTICRMRDSREAMTSGSS
jgi:hypothetical protein